MAAGKGAAEEIVDKAGGEKALGDAAAIQDSILEAALNAFAERGYDGVSVRELNRQIGVSHNLVHYYFRSKDALWRAAIDYGLRPTVEAWNHEPLAPSDDPVEIMQLGLRRFLEVTARCPSVQRILEHEGAVGGPRLNYIAERYILPYLTSLVRFEETTEIEKRGLNLASVVLLTTSGATAFFTRAALARKIGGPDPFSEEGIEQHIRTMVTLLFYGVLGRPPEQASNPETDKQG
jgi:AcrR family transcriptional regulator